MFKLPDQPQSIEVASSDKTIAVGVNDFGLPTGVQLDPKVRELGGAELASRIMTLYHFAKTIALAVRNVDHHWATGSWLSCWPTPTHVEKLHAELTF